MNAKRTCLLWVAVVCLAAVATAWGQATAQINGTVKDQSGAVLPGVEVTATQTETGIARTAVTNEAGSYVLQSLATGPYRLEAALPGFRTFAQTGIVLQVNANPVINPVLEVGQVTETVEVQANATLVETRTVGISQVIENERIMDLPLNGRNVTELITLTAGAVQSGTPAAQNFDSGRFISVNGGLGYGIAYNLDGAPHTDQYAGLGQPFPFPDALQEFKVETSGVTAQNGGQSGAYVNSVTKSGTNEMHGDLFEFVRNDLFNARSYFALKNSSLKRNQFGGTLGGPVIKNKLFFFGGYQGTTTRQDPASTRSFVPTADMLAGDFTAAASPDCNAGRQVTLRTPFVDNKVSPSLFSPAALKVATQLPAAEDKCGQVTWGNINRRNDGQVVGKVDYQASSKHSMFGRYLITWYDVAVPYNLNHNLLSTADRGYHNKSQALTLGSTYLVSPNIVNSFRLSGGLTYVSRVGASIFSAPDIGIKAFSYLKDYIAISVTNAFAVGCGTCTYSTFPNWNAQVNDDISIVRGAHQMVFGGSLSKAYSNGVSNVASAGTYTFNGQQTNLGLADFLTGKLNQLSQSGPYLMLTHRYYLAAFAQDTWKATPKMTLNYGVRWEPYLPQVLDDKRIYNFNYERFQQGIRSTVYPKAPAGLYYPGDPGFPGESGVVRNMKLFQPRVGLAWDVSGDGKTSVRASYGLAYSFLPLILHIDTSAAPPFGNQVIVSVPPAGFDDPWRDIPGGNPFPTVFNKDTEFVQNGLYNTQPYDLKNHYSQSWNLNLQKQFGNSLLISTTYTGSLTLHLWGQKPLNPSVYFYNGTNTCTLPNGTTITGSNGQCSTTANAPARRRLTLENRIEGPYYATLSEFEDGGTMNYHGLVINVQRQPVKGFSASGNYTWSHCIGDRTDFNGSGTNPGQIEWQDPGNRRGDRGNCESDRRHVLNITAVAQTPNFANRALRVVGSGWKLSVIHRRASGSPLTVTSGVDNSLTGIGGQRALQILSDPYGDRSGRPDTNYLNAAAFAIPAPGAYGNVARLSVRGPGTWSLDAAVTRAFQVNEDQKVEFRAEAFNVTNSFRPGNPGASVNGSTFGLIRTAQEPRIMQFALKYAF